MLGSLLYSSLRSHLDTIFGSFYSGAVPSPLTPWFLPPCSDLDFPLLITLGLSPLHVRNWMFPELRDSDTRLAYWILLDPESIPPGPPGFSFFVTWLP